MKCVRGEGRTWGERGMYIKVKTGEGRVRTDDQWIFGRQTFHRWTFGKTDI